MVRTLSTFDLESQIKADGATWLDRRLLARGPSEIAEAGFGLEVRQAMDRRREHLIKEGDAMRREDGRISYRQNLLAIRQHREIDKAGAKLAASSSVPFRAAADGETVQGTFKRSVQLASGKFALIENAREFTLVPWRPVIDAHLGREVSGIIQGESISWQFGKQRGLGL
jgi:hypothetical protein